MASQFRWTSKSVDLYAGQSKTLSAVATTAHCGIVGYNSVMSGIMQSRKTFCSAHCRVVARNLSRRNGKGKCRRRRSGYANGGIVRRKDRDHERTASISLRHIVDCLPTAQAQTLANMSTITGLTDNAETCLPPNEDSNKAGMLLSTSFLADP